MNLTFVPYEEIQRIRGEISDPVVRCQALATIFRLNTLHAIMNAGSGHIGTSFSAMDIITWLWDSEMTQPNEPNAPHSDTYFSSKGHDAPGLYALLTGLGKLPFEKLHQLRKLNGLPGHPHVDIPYMITNTGSLGMGISKARGMAIANRLQGKQGRFYVLTGDGELQEGQFWESLQPTVNGGFSEITVIVDHNKLQSDTYVSYVSDLGDLEAKFRAFGWEVARCDGHDIEAIRAALAHFKTIQDRPQILIADTVKGKGVSVMEHTTLSEPAPQDFPPMYQFHSGAPSEENYMKGVSELTAMLDRLTQAAGVAPVRTESRELTPRIAPQNPQKLVTAYGEELVRLAERNDKIVALDGDLMLDTGLVPFKQRFPDRFVECGIAEMDMVSQAGGMALRGLLPVVHSFACFLTTRPNEQIYNNATEHTKIIYAGSLAGLLPAAPGHSHQSLRDISAIGGMPGLTLFQPCNEEETRLGLRWAVDENEGSTYLRLVTVPSEINYGLPADYCLQKGQGCKLVDGQDVAIIGYGPTALIQAVKAAESLKAQGVSASVINLPWLNFVDADWLAQTLKVFSGIVSLEDHYIRLGQGNLIAEALLEKGISKPYLHLGMTQVPYCGQPAEVQQAHGLDAESIARRIAEFVRTSVLAAV